jgi:hypothetical protein
MLVLIFVLNSGGNSANAVRFSHLTHAVVVGVTSYQDVGLRNLPACAPEARDLAAALTHSGGCAIPGQQV